MVLWESLRFPGASTGTFEAHELRDNDKSRWGKGVLKAQRAGDIV